MQVNAVLTDDEGQRTDINSLADTCVISQYALIVHDSNRPMNVVGYDPSKGIMTTNRRAVLAAVAHE